MYSTVVFGRPPAWTEESLCAQVDINLHHPEKGESLDFAKQVCALCPVRQTCLEWALEHREDHGVWGGLGPQERKELRRTRENADQGDVALAGAAA